MHGTRRHDDVVAQEHAEGLVADQRARAQDGVAEAERLLLPHVGHRGELGDRLDLGQLLRLAAVLEVVLELEGGVEVILDGALVAAGDEDDLVEPRGHRLLHHVLDGGLVDERQHLLRLGLGGGQEARPEPGRGEHGLAHAALMSARLWFEVHTAAAARPAPALAIERLLDAPAQLDLRVDAGGRRHLDRERAARGPSRRSGRSPGPGAARARGPSPAAHSRPARSRVSSARRTSVS